MQKKKSFKELIFGKGDMDTVFFVILLIIITFGLVMLFSASFANAHYYKGDSFYFIKRQAGFAVIGIAAMLLISRIDYHILHKFALPLYGLSLVLLVIVLFCAPSNGARRWIPYPVNFQPSEIAKFAVILLFAHLISLEPEKMKTFKDGFLRFILLLAPVVVLLLLEPHLSGTIIMILIACAMMFIGGTQLRWFGCAGGAAVLGLGAVVLSGKIEYAMTRLKGWIDPFSDIRGDTYQTVQSLIAIGSGGIFGKGLGNSRQKYLFLPEPQNDFIFAIVCEELGLIGAIAVIVLFALLLWRGLQISLKATDKFGALLSAGLIIQIGLQVALNIAVVTNTLPNTGISLPFFSYGGTSLLMLMAQMGVVLSVSRHSNLKKA